MFLPNGPKPAQPVAQVPEENKGKEPAPKVDAQKIDPKKAEALASAFVGLILRAQSTSEAKSAKRERSPRASVTWPLCDQPLKRSTT